MYYNTHGNTTDIKALLDKPTTLSIRFIGASVTAQRNGWVTILLNKIISRRGDAPIKLKKCVMGGVGVIFALANTYDQNNDADLTFLEFSTGDFNQGLTPIKELENLLNALVSRLLLQKTNLIIVHNWREDYKGKLNLPVNQVYERVAKKYKVMEIYNNKLIFSMLENEKIKINTYFRDICHTKESGSELYAEHIFNSLLDDVENNPMVKVNHPQKIEYYSNVYSKVRFYNICDLLPDLHNRQAVYQYPLSGQVFPYIEMGANESIFIRGIGMMLGISYITWPQAGWIGLFVNGKLITRLRGFDHLSYYERYMLRPYKYELTEFGIEIKLLHENVDISIAKKTHPDFNKERKIRIIAIAGQFDVINIRINNKGK